FLAGMHSAKTMASILKVPVLEVTHQDSHIQSGLWSCRHDMDKEFMAYHVSGGTTELLKVMVNGEFSITEIGGTSDLNAGQFIDRIGVAMGIKFPCGQVMDKLCNEFEIEGISIPISIDGCSMSFSGPETHVQRLIRGRVPDRREAAEISKGVFLCIARSIEKTVLEAKRVYGLEELLLVGGVVSNTIIKEYLTKKSGLSKRGIKAFFADAVYSPDNAVGTAVLGMKQISAHGRNK
ncbi:MAG: O-sialoglycoprotein endopeptidase, partial [Pseudomonadota bacterium]